MSSRINEITIGLVYRETDKPGEETTEDQKYIFYSREKKGWYLDDHHPAFHPSEVQLISLVDRIRILYSNGALDQYDLVKRMK